MNSIPACKRCALPMRQVGRYSDWTCECCDESVKCPHVSKMTRWKRKLSGRRA